MKPFQDNLFPIQSVLLTAVLIVITASIGSSEQFMTGFVLVCMNYLIGFTLTGAYSIYDDRFYQWLHRLREPWPAVVAMWWLPVIAVFAIQTLKR